MNRNPFGKILALASLSSFLLLLPSVAANAQTTISSPPATSTLAQQLQAAKQADWQAALDPDVSPTRQGTFLNQMNKADRAFKEVTHGFPVSQAEINDALWMPPRHITPEERAQLISQLQQARTQDDQNEQQMLNGLAWDYSSAPANTQVFDQRKAQIDQVTKNLEIGAPVHWTNIKQALVVVPASY